VFFSRIRPDHTRCRSATWILHMWVYPRRGYIFKFHRNLFSGFGAPGGQIWPFPLLWLLAYTTACTTVQAVIIVYYAIGI